MLIVLVSDYPVVHFVCTANVAFTGAMHGVQPGCVVTACYPTV